MRALIIVLALSAAACSLAGCDVSTDPNNPAIRAFEPVNSCGPGGTQDINQCPSGR